MLGLGKEKTKETGGEANGKEGNFFFVKVKRGEMENAP
jgi:hypothetical protein